MRLLAKDPDDRPQSAREVVEAIEELERGEEDVVDLEVCPPEEETASPSAPVAEEEEPKPEGVSPRRSRVRRKKKQPQPRRDWGPWALATGAALLFVAILALLIVLLRRHTG
jgi:hypothetical protein